MPPKKRSTVNDLLIAAPAAETAIEEDQGQSEIRSTQTKITVLPLSTIVDRVTDTREVKSRHVEALMLSIAALGLLEPLVVDSRGRLLAGGHRKAAIYLLKEQQPTAYAEHFPNELVPVRVLDFDADTNADFALQVEIAENELRRDYTPTEVKMLAERLKAAGYMDTVGRPAVGAKALSPALKVIIGKSLRTVQRYLNENNEKGMTNGVLFSSTDALAKLRSSLIKWQKAYGGSDDEVIQLIGQNVTSWLDQLTEIESSTDKL
jgi:ParB family transcriptional regulator, chromosome partitioning protein